MVVADHTTALSTGSAYEVQLADHDHRDGEVRKYKQKKYKKKKYKRRKYKQRSRDRDIDLVDLPPIDFGTSSCNRDIVGGILGGVTGAVLGSQVGSGDGQVAATAAGTIIGVIVGGSIGGSMDKIDQNCVGQTLEHAGDGETIRWNSPDNATRYEVTPQKSFQSADGSFCREYQTTIIIDGRPERAYGDACRQPDGSWKKATQ